jgi:hypothetical protein
MSITPSGFIEPTMDAAKAQEYMKKFQALKAALLTADDYVSINGKPYIKRSGYRKFALAFNISDEIVSQEHDGDIWRIHVKATAPNGRSAIGIGSCSVADREKLKSQHADHDAYTIAHTRAKNRAISDLIGSGDVSAEEMSAMDANAKAAQLFGAKK